MSDTAPDQPTLEQAVAELQAATDRGSFHKAVGIAESLAHHYGHVPQVLRAYGYCLALLGDDHAALPVLQNALRQAPDQLDIHLTLIRVQLWAGQWQAARQHLQQFPPQAWQHPQILQLGVEAWIQSQDKTPQGRQDALARCDRLLEIQPDDPEGLWLKAVVLGEGDDPAPALAAFQQAWAGQAQRQQQVPGKTLSILRTRLLRDWAALLARAGGEERAGEVCDTLWRACEQRPFNRFTPLAWAALEQALAASPDPDHQALHALHGQIRSVWQRYGQESLAHSFGDFGLPYQGFEPLQLPGTRPALARLARYDLPPLLPPGARALDIGCNHGYLLMGLAGHLSQGEGFDISRACVEVGTLVAQHLGHTHILLSHQTFDDFMAGTQAPFDLVMACAVHHWIDRPLPEFGAALRGLCKPGGHLLLESQGTRHDQRTEADFEQKAQVIAGAGFECVRTGELCDDGVNFRVFRILRRLSP